jgi:hypothetical protein
MIAGLRQRAYHPSAPDEKHGLRTDPMDSHKRMSGEIMFEPPPAALVASRTVIACSDRPELVELERLNLNRPAPVASSK